MKYYTAFLLLLFASNIFAQNDPKAKEILDKAAEKFKTYQAAEIDFTIAMDNKAENISEKHEGKAFMKGNKYKLELMGVVNYYDGKNIYTYMPEVEEVNIKNPSDEEENMLNPTELFDIHNKGFRQNLVSQANTNAYIELLPTDKKHNFIKIGIWANPSTSTIQKVTSFGKDGNNVTVTINKITELKDIDDSFFKFDTEKHPEVDVIDLR